MKFARVAGALVLTLAALLIAGCARQTGIQSSEEESRGDQELPFSHSSTADGRSPTASILDTSIPPGTQIAVRLQAALSSATARNGDAFAAILDQPIVVQGQTVAARGTSLTGKVVEAKASGSPQDPGYLRIALTGISIDGKSFTLQTSSIFVKAGSREQPRSVSTSGSGIPDKQDVGLPFDRKLTFRLTEVVPIHG